MPTTARTRSGPVPPDPPITYVDPEQPYPPKTGTTMPNRAKPRPYGTRTEGDDLGSYGEPGGYAGADLINDDYTPANGNGGYSGGSSVVGSQITPAAQTAQPAQNSYTIHGYRPADLNDPNDSWNAFLTTGQYGVPKDAAGAGELAKLFNEWGKTNGGWNATVGGGSGDKWTFNNGKGVIDSADVITDIGGPTSGFWYGDSMNFPGGGRTEGSGAGGGAAGGGSATGGSVGNAFSEALLKLLNPQAASLSDPDLAAQVQANRVEQQRGVDRRRALAAERAAQMGTQGGGFDAALDTLEAARSDQEGRFGAGLLADKENRNKQALLAALSPSLGLLGLNQQGDQFTQSLNQNNSQFNSQLGLNSSIANATLNQNALLALLGMAG